MNNDNNNNFKIDKSVMLFTSGVFNGKKVRITEKYVSIFDVISVAGGQKNPRDTWNELLNKYKEEVVGISYNFKFPGPGQRETPCVDVYGLVKLLMWIPGKKAAEFRNLTANVMVKYLGGDTTLASEVKTINDTHMQTDCMNIFRQAIPKKITYDSSYWIYVRVYNRFFEDQQKDLECSNIRLSFFIIKFGIAKFIQQRESNYGNDFGFFQYAIKLPNKEYAMNIEKIIRQKFKDITVENSYEYLDSKKLAKMLGAVNEKDPDIFETRLYYKTAELLYTKILTECHLHYPKELENENFGIMFHPKKEESINDIKISCSEIKLIREHLQDYNIILETNKLTCIKQMTSEEINQTTEEENKFLKNRLKKLVTIVEDNNPELLTEYEEDYAKAEQHKKEWSKHKIYQYTLDGKYVRKFDTISSAARKYDCTTKIIRISIQNNKSCFGFLWKSSRDIDTNLDGIPNDLPIRKIDCCDPNDYKILKTYNSFEEINKVFRDKNDFVLSEIYRAIDLGFIYAGFRWKFVNTSLKLGFEVRRTGMKKRVIKMDDNYNELEEFTSLIEAIKSVNIKSKGSLSTAIKNNKKLAGYYWEYKDLLPIS